MLTKSWLAGRFADQSLCYSFLILDLIQNDSLSHKEGTAANTTTAQINVTKDSQPAPSTPCLLAALSCLGSTVGSQKHSTRRKFIALGSIFFFQSHFKGNVFWMMATST